MTTKKYVWVEHVAGEYRDELQKCSRCGSVIIDVRGFVSTDGRSPRTFRRGVIYKTDGCTMVIRPDGPEDDVVQCGGEA